MIRFHAQKKLLTSDGPIDLNIDLEIAARECLTLFGKSGAGKTTALRILAGLTRPEQGYIEVDGKVWLDSTRNICLPPQQRPVGFVFQDYALFPNMTVRENLRYALAAGEDSVIVEELLEAVDLHALAQRRPASLSGGQRQRVALARALVRRPKLLLLDEPLSALDMEMRGKLQDEILKLQQRFPVTTLLVSHNLAEIFRLSQRVALIERGRITALGLPAEVFITKQLSGKFKFEGEILAIQPEDVVYIVTVSIGQNVVRVIATDSEVDQLRVGDRVIVSSKAFNPILMPVR